MRLTADTFRSLYLEYGPRAQGFFMRMTGYDIDLSRDLTQDLFMRLFNRRIATVEDAFGVSRKPLNLNEKK